MGQLDTARVRDVSFSWGCDLSATHHRAIFIGFRICDVEEYVIAAIGRCVQVFCRGILGTMSDPNFMPIFLVLTSRSPYWKYMAQSFFIHIFLMNGTVIFAQVTGVNRFLHRDFFHKKKNLRIFINVFFNKKYYRHGDILNDIF